MWKVVFLGCVTLSLAQKWQVPSKRDCYGSELEDTACNSAPCSECIPKNCVLGEWGEWNNNGDCSGLAERHRVVLQHNNECGTPCNAVLIETKVDIDLECIPKRSDCVFGPWSGWTGACSTYTAQKFRTRSITHPATGTGSPCTGETAMTAPCGTPGPPINCVVADWGSWTTCSTTCGVGRKTRVRRIKSEGSNGGTYCTDPLMEVMVCYQANCDTPAPCKYSDWTDWCGCDIVPGMHVKPWYRDRKREVLSPAYAGATPCDGVLKESEGCTYEPPRDCTFHPWSEWTLCDRTCGSGQRFRNRKELTEPIHAGTCPLSSLRETEACNTQTCETGGNCVLSLWSEWGACSEHCGFGQRERTRDVEKEGEVPGIGCDDIIKEMEKCEITPCPKTDCLWDEWLEWSDCTCSCDGGTKVRNRHIKVAPVNGGELCPAKVKTEVEPCNTGPCSTKVCTNGLWGVWSQWSQCSVTCGSGYQSRKRHVESMANDCGTPAIGDKEEYRSCAQAPCYHDRDCSFTAWSPWSACSCSCFGHTERSRTIAAYALGNGKPCVGDLRQSESCHPGVSITGEWELPSPEGCQPPPEMPVCEYSEWTPWSPCTATCNGGHTARDRKIVNRPCKQVGPVVALVQTKSCNTQECFVECIDCAWDLWGEWSSCTKCGDEKTRHRHIKQYPNHCGKPCALESEQEVAECESTCEKKFYCVWTEWFEAGTCSASCGAATKMRDRHLHMLEARPASFLFSGGEDMHCTGVQTEMIACALPVCPNLCTPQNCAFGEWGEWHAPSCEGLCSRSRVRVTENNECGEPCRGPLVETKECPTPCQEHPVDCTFTAWSHWQHCMEVTSQRSRFREIDQAPKYGGTPCEGSLKETEPCGTARHHEVPCVVSPWSAWTKCYTTCGGGVRERTRYVQSAARGGGLGCMNSLAQLEGCNTQPCEEPRVPVDCQLGEWAEWTPNTVEDKYDCTMDGQRFRHRSILVMPKNKGKACVGPLKVTEPCTPPVIDCVMSLWTEWDDCDKTCGGGQQQRHRLTKKPYPQNGGKECPRTILQTQPCNVEPCFKGNCELGTWTQWGACSVTCGSGMSTRTRTVTKEASAGGVGCADDTAEMRECTGGIDCGQDTDCTWGVWNEWSECSCSCDGGVRRRARLILTFPTGNGKTCPANAKNEIQPCNTQPCGHCVDGVWGAWGAWSACSATCVGGVQFRHRNVAQRANECGVPVSGLQQDVMKCSVGVPCHPDVDCQWREWGEWHGCSASCDGTKRRAREIGVQGHGKGQFCVGPAEEVVTCNPSTATPGCVDIVVRVDCELSVWTSWTACSASCGTGQTKHTRSVLTEAQGVGAPCVGALEEVKDCAAGACPSIPGIACVWCDWNEWGDCTKCAGQSFRTRAICTYNKFGGKPCDPGAARETRACDERVCHKKLYCNWGEWQEWGDCSTSCGHGTKSRRRDLIMTTEMPQMTQLAEQNDELQQRIESEMNQRMQHLVIAFSAGAASLVVVLSVLRAYQTWTQVTLVPEPTHSNAPPRQEQSSAQDMYRSIELENVE